MGLEVNRNQVRELANICVVTYPQVSKEMDTATRRRWTKVQSEIATAMARRTGYLISPYDVAVLLPAIMQWVGESNIGEVLRQAISPSRLA